MDKVNNSSKKLFLIVVLAVIVMGVGATSYAYFSVQRMGGSNAISGKVVSDGPRMDFKEETVGATLVDTYPMPDELAMTKDGAYKFTLRNMENKDVKAKVILEVTEESTLDDSLVNVLVNDDVLTLGSLSTVDASNGFKKAYLLTTLDFVGGETIKNELKFWVNENGTIENASNVKWESRVLIVPEFK